MPALNRVQIIGNLGTDPETRYTPNGTLVCSFRVAVNRRWKSAQGENREATEWFSIETWGRLAEICHQYLTKGRLVFLEGRLQTDRWEKNGETRYFTKVIANQVQSLERKPEEPELVEEEAEALVE